MQRKSKIVLGTVALIAVVGVAATVTGGSDPAAAGSEGVAVVRADIVDKALAVGEIEPLVEIDVKSKISGVVQRRFAEAGDYVKAGAPLLEIRPDPTPLELAEASRQVELRQIELANVERELERQKSLREQGLLSEQEFEAAQRRSDEARLQLQMARERLALLRQGRITIADRQIESVITAPISGYILQEMVEIGDPVVPLTSYQEGTVLMTMADMSQLIFRGTVDEIDVGRLREGMPVEIKVGALPQARIRGVLSRISLKAERDQTAIKFPVEITLTDTGGALLRAGYSANAEIIIEERRNVLAIPERTVTFEGDSAWVEVITAAGTKEKRYIRTGLSDAIQLEVVKGLEEGERVAEKPVREIG